MSDYSTDLTAHHGLCIRGCGNSGKRRDRLGYFPRLHPGIQRFRLHFLHMDPRKIHRLKICRGHSYLICARRQVQDFAGRPSSASSSSAHARIARPPHHCSVKAIVTTPLFYRCSSMAQRKRGSRSRRIVAGPSRCVRLARTSGAATSPPAAGSRSHS